MPSAGDPPSAFLSKRLVASGKATPTPAPMSLPEPEFFRNFS